MRPREQAFRQHIRRERLEGRLPRDSLLHTTTNISRANWNWKRPSGAGEVDRQDRVHDVKLSMEARIQGEAGG